MQEPRKGVTRRGFFGASAAAVTTVSVNGTNAPEPISENRKAELAARLKVMLYEIEKASYLDILPDFNPEPTANFTEEGLKAEKKDKYERLASVQQAIDGYPDLLQEVTLQ